MGDTDLDWERFAQDDAFWAVLTREEHRQAQSAEASSDVFYASGVAHVEEVLAFLRDRFDAPERFGTSLDFGCGVGRLLFALAARSDTAIGVDVAPTMLATAREQARVRGVDNVELELSSMDLDHDRETVDLITSYIVLQHIPTETGTQLIRRLLNRLRPGGFGYLHTPIAHASDNLWCESGNTTGAVFSHYQRLGDSLVRLGKEPVSGVDVMQMNHYNANELLVELYRHGVSEVASRISEEGGALGVEWFFRKSEVSGRSTAAWGQVVGTSVGMPAREGVTQAGVDVVGVPVGEGPLARPAFMPFSVSGWALDPDTKGLALGVDVVIDGVPYAASYGLPRPDVAEHFEVASSVGCGFLLTVPGGCLESGQHEVRVRVVLQDGWNETEPVLFDIHP